jgi:hypothetical protein
MVQTLIGINRPMHCHKASSRAFRIRHWATELSASSTGSNDGLPGKLRGRTHFTVHRAMSEPVPCCHRGLYQCNFSIGWIKCMDEEPTRPATLE